MGGLVGRMDGVGGARVGAWGTGGLRVWTAAGLAGRMEGVYNELLQEV